MYSIFCVYTMYIPCIYHVYTWYILRIYMVYTWYIPYSTRWLGLRRRAGVRARAYPPAGQRLHTVTQTRPRARARAHVRTSAHTRAREHLAHARTSARPCKPERASTINGEQGIGPNQMVSKLCMPVVPTVLIFKIPREQEKNVCAVHTLPPTSGQWFPTHLCVHY